MSGRVVFALVAVLFLSACGPKTAPTTPQGVPQASPTISSTSAQKNAATPALVAPETEKIDIPATQAAYVDAIATANAETDFLRDQLANANLRKDEIDLAKKEAERETAKYEAAQVQSVTDRVRAQADEQAAITAGKQADNERLRLLAELAKAQASETAERTRQVTALVVGALCICGLLVMAGAMRSRPAPVQPAPEPDEFPELHKLDPKLMHPGDTLDMDRMPPGDPVKFSQFATYALSGFALGVNAVEKSTPYTRDEYAPVYVWMDRKSFIGPGRDGKSKGLSASGARYCEEWLEHNPVPPPRGEDEPKHDATGS